MQIEPLVLGVNDAAAFIGLSRARLYELLAEKKIEARKLGSRTLIPVESLRSFVLNAPRIGEVA